MNPVKLHKNDKKEYNFLLLYDKKPLLFIQERKYLL